MNFFKAPVAARAMRTLDRSIFSKSWPTSAASIRENKLISKYRKGLEKTNEVFTLEKFDPIVSDPDPVLASQGRKCLILQPAVKAGGL